MQDRCEETERHMHDVNVPQLAVLVTSRHITDIS